VNTITRADFIEWKANPVTRAFMDAAQFRIDECKDILSYSAGTDYMQDRLLVGMIQSYREMQDFRVDEDEEIEQ